MSPHPPGPIGDLTVVELAGLVSGPYCAKLLADFGADVIKVEQAGSPDPARAHGPFPGDEPDPEQSGLFLYLNTNKRGVTLDLETAEGLAVLKDLLARADVFVEDRPRAELERLGLDYDSLRELNPGLVVTSVTAFGRVGPWRDHKGYHLTSFHTSGQGYLLPMNSPDTEREPVKGGGFVGDYDAGLTAAIGTLGALFSRAGTGVGQHVDVSAQHALMHLEKSQLRRFVDDGRSPNRTGMGRLLETLVMGKDGNYVVIILSSQHQWKGLFEAMDRPEWAATPPFDTQAGRSANYPELRSRLQEWADGYTAEEIFHKIQGARSACAPVYLAEHFMASPQIAERDFLVDIEHPVAGDLRYPGRPFPMSNVEWRGTAPAPLAGQHTEEVLRDGLDYSDDRIAELRAAGAI